jgi:hypothetical protein
MSGIFVSYRRDDSQGFAGRLADDLAELLGPDRVFRDIEIPVGSDFTDVLHRAISACDILLVVIGRHWASTSNQGYPSRLFEPTDWVRTEIEAAFAQGKQVVPVLVGGAEVPRVGDMPESIGRLTRLQAAFLSDRHWDSQVAELAERLKRLDPLLAQGAARGREQEESPAEVLRELGDRVLKEVESRRRPRVNPPSLPRSLAEHLMHAAGRGLKRVLSVALGLGLIYLGIRLFGDEKMLGHLDAFEARLQIGWERLQQYVAAWKAG